MFLAVQCHWAFCPARSLDLIWWLSFQVPDCWKSIDLSEFSGTRPMEFHRSSHWNFKTLCITPHWVCWAKLHFWPLGHLSNRFQGKKLKKLPAENHFSLFENWHFLENHLKKAYTAAKCWCTTNDKMFHISGTISICTLVNSLFFKFSSLEH